MLRCNSQGPHSSRTVAAVTSTGDRTAFATLLRALRQRASLTQEELAARAGVTAYAVSALERGTRTRPYPHTVRALADGLGADDADRAALAAAARPDTDEPAEAAAAPVTGLVVPTTRLHGREDDLAAVRGFVDRGARLVTLTGPGGVGKTRLAAALCEALAASHPDGVAQVSLAPLADAEEVMPTLARALRLTTTDAAEALDVVVAHLATRRVLLLLDNAEHLLSAGPGIARVVAGCPDVTVLVTSRAPLRVRDEQEYAVAPLAVPDEGTDTLAGLRAAPAGALLLDRAGAVTGAAPDDPQDVVAFARLCQRLSGLPLALELVSAQLRVLPPRELVERLDDVMATSGARDLPLRQRTIRATLDWSHGLLGPDEQRLFTLLGAFRGGATLAAVERVSGLPLGEVLGLLEQLVAHSLVLVRPGAEGVRYDMLEPVAQYARSLLVGEDAERAARAHAQHFAELAERAAQGYEQADQVAWFARTEADQANILLAIDRSLDLGDTRTASRLTWSMWLYWWLRGQLSTGRRRAEACLAAVPPDDLLGRVHLTTATMAYAGGEVDDAERQWAEAARLGEEQADPELACKGVAGLALVHIARAEWAPAAERLREALPLSRAAGDHGIWVGILAHVWLGTVLLQLGDTDEALGTMRRGLALARDRGDRLGSYIALYNLAQAALAAGEAGPAREHLEEGIALSQQTGDRANLAYFVEALAVVESGVGCHDRVATLLGAAQALREGVGANVYMYYVPDEEQRAAAERSARDALGAEAYDDAVDRGRGLDVDQLARVCVG